MTAAQIAIASTGPRDGFVIATMPAADDARWVGTCARTADGLVWHLYEIGAGT